MGLSGGSKYGTSISTSKHSTEEPKSDATSGELNKGENLSLWENGK